MRAGLRTRTRQRRRSGGARRQLQRLHAPATYGWEAAPSLSGKQGWRVDTKRDLSGGVGADADLVLVGTRKGEVLAFDLNGKPVWTAQVSSEVLSAPRAADAGRGVRKALAPPRLK